MRCFRHRMAWLCLLVMGAAAAVPPCAAQTWSAPARELAGRILAHTQSRSAMALAVQNRSSLDSADAADIRNAIAAQLRALGVRLVPADQAVDDVRVTLSENAGGLVWVAEVGRGEQREVAILEVPAVAAATARPASDPLSIRRVPLVSQPEQMLDAAMLASDSALLVLDAASVKLFRNDGGRWKLQAASPIAHEHPWPRDLRGRLVVQGDSFTAYLPGTLCAGPWSHALSATCRSGDDPWPLPPVGGAAARAAFNASRNFFSGALAPGPGADPGPFFYAAPVAASDGRTQWLIGGLDGTVRLLGAPGQTMGTFAGWGSDWAVVSGGCAAGPYVLATRADSETADALRLLQVSGRRATEAAPPLDLPGTVTALWPSQDGGSAVVVTRNLKTGEYEASSLALHCGR